MRKKTKTKFVLITGCAGAGKTTLGQELIKKLHYLYVDKDTLTRKFTDLILEYNGSSKEDRESDFYCSKVRPIEYEIAIDFCLENLKLGNNVMLIMPMISYITNYETFNQLINIDNLKKLGIQVKIIWLEHDEELEYKRILNRHAERDKNKLNNWQEYLKSVENIQPDKLLNTYNFHNKSQGIKKEDLQKMIKWIKK